MQVKALIVAAGLVACGCAHGQKAGAVPRASQESHTPAEGNTAHEDTGAPHAPPSTLAGWAESAMLFDDLGTLHRPVSTKNEEAQAYFDQGLRLTYGFNHDEATRSFARAAMIDPSCAMCFWGVSYTLGPNYNMPMQADRAAVAWQALEQAQQLAPSASAVEQALISALAQRYHGPEPLDAERQRPYDQAYAEAMRYVARAHPADDDVQVLFAEALMDLNPWKLWMPTGAPAAGTPEIVRALETVLARSPEHPGANHYYIHAVEASPRPEMGIPAADRLGRLMPGAGHIVHMPAHIYQRVGRYADAAAVNRKAIEVDQRYLSRTRPPGYYPMYIGHNWGFLSYATSMEGRSAESIAAAREAAKALPPSMLEAMPGMDFFTAEPLLAMVRFGRWDEILKEPRPPAQYQALTALWLHAMGTAKAKTGRVADAKSDLDELRALREAMPESLNAGNSPARAVADVAAKALEARIAEKEGKIDEAIGLYREAVALEDKLGYSEPATWFAPLRHDLGAALLDAGRFADAEAVFRKDLEKHPANGWALFGLSRALQRAGKAQEAARIDKEFRKAWANADFELERPAF